MIEQAEPLRQEYEKYTAEDHKVWSLLYGEQIENLPSIATKSYLEGIKRVEFKPNYVPNFDNVNRILKELTGWEVYVVPGLIDNKPFFEHLANREFPATTWLRTMAQLKYIEEPDMFHDVFGHVPLLSDAQFCGFLEGLSKIALKYIDNIYAVELVTRIYWYTIEFGLIQEDGALKIYGAGLLSSPGESKYSVSNEPPHLAYDVKTIMDTPYIKETFQPQYFVINSYQQLFDSLSEIETIIEKHVKEGIKFKLSY